jgi:hypothetical protein
MDLAIESDQGPRWAARRAWLLVLQYGAFGAMLFGIKLWVIGSYGNATPFWDQWSAEAQQLYKPFLEGAFDWRVLFATANEHRILTARLLYLGLLVINGIWNPLLEMVVGALLHLIALILCLVLLTRVLGKAHLRALLLFSLIVFGLPFDWENTLLGFSAQFYFLLLFSIAGLWLTVIPPPFSGRWWLGVACTALAFFSVASGAFAFAAAAFVGVVFYATRLRRTRGQLGAVAILAALFLLGLAVTPTVAHNAPLRASSPLQFLGALSGILDWPLGWGAFGAVFRNLPALGFLGLMFWKRPPATDTRWFLLALVLWSLGQEASIAYGRAVGNLASRYTDLYTIAILVNFASLLSIAQDSSGPRTVWAHIGAAAWTLLVLAFVLLNAERTLPTDLAAKRDLSVIQESNTRCYVATGDFNCLGGKLFGYVPFPFPDRLAEMLTWPSIRAILPSNIRTPLAETSLDIKPAGAFVPDGYDPNTPGRSSMTLGSYTGQGDAAKGQAWIRFDGNSPSPFLEIPVAGYPLGTGMRMAIEENGQRIPVVADTNPGASWGVAHVRLGSGSFSIHLIDSSTTEWLAVGAPVVVGRLDWLTNDLLAAYPVFMMLGLAGWVLSVMLRGLDRAGA